MKYAEKIVAQNPRANAILAKMFGKVSNKYQIYNF